MEQKSKQEISRISMKMCFRKILKYHIPGYQIVPKLYQIIVKINLITFMCTLAVKTLDFQVKSYHFQLCFQFCFQFQFYFQIHLRKSRK